MAKTLSFKRSKRYRADHILFANPLETVAEMTLRKPIFDTFNFDIGEEWCEMAKQVDEKTY